MQKALNLFQRIASDLLEDEKKNPVSDYIPVQDLYKQIDLALRENPISEQEFESVLREVVFASQEQQLRHSSISCLVAGTKPQS